MHRLCSDYILLYSRSPRKSYEYVRPLVFAVAGNQLTDLFNPLLIFLAQTANEDIKFREYLTANGFDVSLMGLKDEGTRDSNTAKEKGEAVDVARDASSDEDEKKGTETV